MVILNAEDGFNKLADLSNTIQILVGSSDLFFSTSSGTQSNDISSLLFDKYPTTLNTSTLGYLSIFFKNFLSVHFPYLINLDNCTCCVIKPHAVKSRNVGKIMHEIITQVKLAFLRLLMRNV